MPFLLHVPQFGEIGTHKAILLVKPRHTNRLIAYKCNGARILANAGAGMQTFVAGADGTNGTDGTHETQRGKAATKEVGRKWTMDNGQ